MSRSFEALLRAALHDPDAEAELIGAFSRPAAAVVFGYSGSRHRAHAMGPAYAAALGRAAEDAVLGALEPDGAAQASRRLRDGLLLVFATPQEALHGAMDGLAALGRLNRDRRGRIGDGSRRDPIGAGVGIGFGTLLISPEPDALGEEADAAFHLAGAAGPGEILASDAFMAALGAPPPGVGSHRGRADRAHAIGTSFTVLLDYRA